MSTHAKDRAGAAARLGGALAAGLVALAVAAPTPGAQTPEALPECVPSERVQRAVDEVAEALDRDFDELRDRGVRVRVSACAAGRLTVRVRRVSDGKARETIARGSVAFTRRASRLMWVRATEAGERLLEDLPRGDRPATQIRGHFK